MPYSKDFSTCAIYLETLKDSLELFVFGISLHEIRDELSALNLNYEVYIELEDYYRKEKKEARALILSNRNKKMALPPCNKDYPVCFHRIEIEKKLGAVENAMILKNGLTVKEQMVDDYLLADQEEEWADVSYSTFDQCEIGRHEHVCHLNEQESHSKIDPKAQKF